MVEKRIASENCQINKDRQNKNQPKLIPDLIFLFHTYIPNKIINMALINGGMEYALNISIFKYYF